MEYIYIKGYFPLFYLAVSSCDWIDEVEEGDHDVVDNFGIMRRNLVVVLDADGITVICICKGKNNETGLTKLLIIHKLLNGYFILVYLAKTDITI